MRVSSIFLLVSATAVGGAGAGAGCASGDPRVGSERVLVGSGAPSATDSPTAPPSDEHWPPPSPPKPPGPQPDLGKAVSLEVAPPAISGGTLIVLGDGKTAVATDPDRDRVYLVDLSVDKPATREITLQTGDEPGRVVEGGGGEVHVALRRGGAIVTIDVETGNVHARRVVCPAPRGIAYDGKTDLLHVACLGGELVTLPAPSGAPTRTLRLEPDLRDVLIRGDHLVITKFRSAETLFVDAKGSIFDRMTSWPAFDVKRSPSIAWRAVSGKTLFAVVHQSGQDGPVGTNPGGYGGGAELDPCGSSAIVSGHVTVVDDEGGTAKATKTSTVLPNAVLPVDLAISAEGRLAVVAPGNAHNPGVPQLLFHEKSLAPSDACGGWTSAETDGEITAVAFFGEDLVVQSRQPAELRVYRKGASSVRVTTLSTLDRTDTGHRIFHANSGAFVACASCHPEGGDDGRVWNFQGIGGRRTQTFRGGLLGTEPFHWDGEQHDLRALVTTVFQSRMSGPILSDDQLATLAKWLDRVPALPNSIPQDPTAVARGDVLFHDTVVGCTACHSGPKLTNNKTIDVGTAIFSGGKFQVPSLRGVAHRAPYLHSGCAATLTDRFGPCGGGDDHGKTSHLSAAQIADLVAYLQTL